VPRGDALHIAARDGFLAFADAIVRDDDGNLAFVPDHLLGDDPEQVTAGLRDAFGRLLDEQDFNGLLLAHGDPTPSRVRAELERFLSG
jgi:hypothetical protein